MGNMFIFYIQSLIYILASLLSIYISLSLYIYIYALRYFLQEWGKGCRKSYWLVVQMKKSEKENICK